MFDENKPFEAHGTYCYCNLGGYAVELSPCGTMARLKMEVGEENGDVTDWFEIEHVLGEDCPTCGEDVDKCQCEDGPEYIAVINPSGYNIPLNMVMRIER